ncbi:MAG: hypothetical protein AAFP92_33115, partial [Bacteroidota bacterium]
NSPDPNSYTESPRPDARAFRDMDLNKSNSFLTLDEHLEKEIDRIFASDVFFTSRNTLGKMLKVFFLF